MATQRIAEEACKLELGKRQDHYFAYEGILENVGTKLFRSKILKAAPSKFFEMPDVPESLLNLARGKEKGGADIGETCKTADLHLSDRR